MHSKLSRSVTIGLVALLLLPYFSVRTVGEEGMFLPDTLNRFSEQQLERKGLKIPLTDIYNSRGVSFKDAVVIVGDGDGTGAFVSPEGLLLTNYHVALTALASASDTSKDFATGGFKANSRADELPIKDYSISITQDIQDVTGEVLKDIPATASAQERENAITGKTNEIEFEQSRKDDGITVRVLPMFEGLSYYKFTYLTLKDVRVVYAPPKSVGFFGGDADNFGWPRHCADFAFMRAYVGSNGKPAPFASTNIPYKPKKFLPLSLAGVKEGDFTMSLGYPGQSRRYRESFSVAHNRDVALPFSIDIATQKIAALENAGKQDPALKIKVQGEIFELANKRKHEEGSVKAMRHADIVGRKRAQEAAFTKWVEADPARKAKYGEVLPNLSKAYQELSATVVQDLLGQQLYYSTPLISVAISAQEAAEERANSNNEKDPGPRAREQALENLADRRPVVEHQLLTYLFRRAAELPEGQRIESIEKRFSGLQGDARRRAEEEFARAIVYGKNVKTTASIERLFSISTAQLRDLREPFVDFASDLRQLLAVQETRPQFNTILRYRTELIRGMIEMNGAKPYPDADGTLRFSHGEVKGYVTHDAATRSAFSYLSELLGRVTTREPFNAPASLKQLYDAREFGRWGTADGANVPVNFLTTLDIVSGNSGSPVLNGRGEQVGIIFDRNYEGLGNDFFYEGEKGRTIAVDIRYVMFITEKFGGAGYILKELDLRDASRQRSAAE